jgi:nucleotide-binding universal stress UspA family protein
LVEAPPVQALREQAAEAAEIVVGSRGLGGFRGALLGSVSTRVAGRAHCPVVVVRSDCNRTLGEVVVGVDTSPECLPALCYAFEQAAVRGCTLRALNAWQIPVYPYSPEILYGMDEIRAAQQKVLSDRLAGFRERYPQVGVVEDVQCAHPVDALVEAGDKAVLVVLGTHGRGAVSTMLFGSVSRPVLHHARCAVAVVHSPPESQRGDHHDPGGGGRFEGGP